MCLGVRQTLLFDPAVSGYAISGWRFYLVWAKVTGLRATLIPFWGQVPFGRFFVEGHVSILRPLPNGHRAKAEADMTRVSTASTCGQANSRGVRRSSTSENQAPEGATPTTMPYQSSRTNTSNSRKSQMKNAVPRTYLPRTLSSMTPYRSGNVSARIADATPTPTPEIPCSTVSCPRINVRRSGCTRVRAQRVMFATTSGVICAPLKRRVLASCRSSFHETIFLNRSIVSPASGFWAMCSASCRFSSCVPTQSSSLKSNDWRNAVTFEGHVASGLKCCTLFRGFITYPVSDWFSQGRGSNPTIPSGLFGYLTAIARRCALRRELPRR